MKRSSGVLMHISTLPGDYSIGSLGKEARRFVDLLCDCGFTYWQTLPFCMPDEYNSPYKSHSAFSLNPYFIDLETIYDEGYITIDELESARQVSPFSCEFDRLAKERLALLRSASKKAPADKISAFANEHPHIDRFCRFMALRTANRGAPWQLFKTDTVDEDELLFWRFTQYEFVRQWLALKAYANARGIKLIGDMPMFVDIDSSDVYFNKEEFLLDESGNPTAVAGVPPDYFAKDGQMWGNPHYNWDAMEKNGFAWWRDRFAHNLTFFDGVRVDHFRGLESYFSIPYGAKSAKEGRWVKAKGREMLDSISDITSDKLVIAEDLGDITEEVNELVRHTGFPGMRVLQFGFLSRDDTVHRPHNYINNSIAYTGTHDNNTLLGYAWEMSEDSRRHLFDYCGCKSDLHGDYHDSVLRTLFASAAGAVIIPIQDILRFGSDTRMNTPGSSSGNWAFRVTRENLASIDKPYYKKLSELYGR